MFKQLLIIVTNKFIIIKNKIKSLFLSKEERKKRELYTSIKKLHNLIKYIDSRLPNRHARKQFWRDFIKHGQIRNDFLSNFVDGLK